MPTHSDHDMNYLLRFLAVAILLTTLATWSTEPASACSCAPRDPAEMLDKSYAAFIGKVVARVEPPVIATSADLVTYTFAVESVAKGNLTEFVEVLSPISSISCGFGDIARVGRRLAITVWTDNDGNYQSGFCSTMVPSDMASVSVMSEPAPGRISIVPSPVPSTDGEVSEEPARVSVLTTPVPAPDEPPGTPHDDLYVDYSESLVSRLVPAVVGGLAAIVLFVAFRIVIRRRNTPKS